MKTLLWAAVGLILGSVATYLVGTVVYPWYADIGWLRRMFDLLPGELSDIAWLHSPDCVAAVLLGTTIGIALPRRWLPVSLGCGLGYVFAAYVLFPFELPTVPEWLLLQIAAEAAKVCFVVAGAWAAKRLLPHKQSAAIEAPRGT